MKISIRIKLCAFLAVLLFLTVCTLSISVLHGIGENQEREQEAYLAQQVKTANMYVRQLNHTKNSNGLDEFLQSGGDDIAKQLDKMTGMNVALYNMDGEEVGNSLLFSGERDTKDILSHALKDSVTYQVMGDTMDYMSPLYDVDGQVGVIRLQYSLKKYFDFYEGVKSLFISIGLAVVALSFMGGYFYFDRFAQLILMLKKDAGSIGNDEIGELSQGIYRMNIRIKESIFEMEEEQRKLELAVHKLKQMEKQQKTFIGNITHEFKTPLTVIKAYVDLLDMYEDDPELIKDAKSSIGKEAGRLHELVEKALRLSSLEKYDFELRSEKLDIKEVIEEICSRMRGKAKKFDIVLEEKVDKAFILGDRESLMHIFINIIDNAIKYNEPKGSILITNHIEKDRVCVELSDTGRGIPKEDREKVFDSFYTVDKNRSREYGGTGLGLAIVKGLVEKQGGSIDVADNKPKGTTFTVSFPLY